MQCPLCEKNLIPSFKQLALHLSREHQLLAFRSVYVCSCGDRFLVGNTRLCPARLTKDARGIYLLMKHLKQHRIRTREDWQRHAVESTLLRGVSE